MTATGAAEKKAKREMHLSEGGKGKSFPKAPNLLQYVSTGTYFARVKVDGKVIWQSLFSCVVRWSNYMARPSSSIHVTREKPSTQNLIGAFVYTIIHSGDWRLKNFAPRIISSAQIAIPVVIETDTLLVKIPKHLDPSVRQHRRFDNVDVRIMRSDAHRV